MIWFILAAFAVLPAILFYEQFFFHYLAMRVQKRAPGGDFDVPVQRLRLIARLPSITGPAAKRTVYYLLGDRLVFARRYEEALEPLRIAIGNGKHPLAPAIHGRLADALEGLGRVEEAERERAQAMSAADSVGKVLTISMARGKEADRQGRHREAAAHFEEVIRQARSASVVRQYRVRVTLQYFQAGDPEKTIFWAEQGINDPRESVEHRCIYRRLAGYSCINLGWYEDAEVYLTAAFDEALQAGNHESADNSLAGLITLHHCLGDLQRAVHLAGSSWPSTSLKSRPARMALALCLTDLGRFDEARAAIYESLGDKPLAIPKNERGSRAAQYLALAQLEIEEGNIQAAVSLVEENMDVLKSPKVMIYVDCQWAYLLAETGRLGEATTLMDQIDESMSTQSLSATTRRDCLFYLPRAAIAAGKYDRAVRYCEARLAVPPHPVGMPTTYCLLGDAYIGIGDRTNAKIAYEQGLSYGIETIWTERIRRRLEEM